MIRVYLISLFVCALLSCNNRKREITNGTPLFHAISSDYSNINFINSLKEDVSTRQNLLDFDYFYNGAGVAVCDLDNDGYPEIFFSGNQVKNQLYHNLGGMVFEDISDHAGINVGKYWSNGVCFADVNNDGWLDIYVSQGGPYDRVKRKNLLYVNQKNLTFKEMAFEFGLDDQGISTQSAFFDYDQDGDMDCLVMNESELYGHDPITFHRMLMENPGRFQVSFSHLYENRGGRFHDVSTEAGIVAPTFGIGLAISDINNDGWLDIYIANDYYLPDNLYINRKNGSFSDRTKNYLEQISFYGMGIDIADLNNDTYQDIVVVDMASQDHIRSKTLMASMNVDNFKLLVQEFGFAPQYMFNTVQLNDGSGHYGNIAHLAGLAKTDWSWAALANDYDLDGDKDILVTNGYRRYALDNDFKLKVQDVKRQYVNGVPLDIKQKLYDEMPSEPLPNLFFRNDGDLKFSEVGKEVGLELPSFSNGAAAADLDRDGDLDLVVSNIDQTALLYENSAANRADQNFLKVVVMGAQADHAKVTIHYQGQKAFVELQTVRGYRSSMPSDAFFGLGSANRVDTLIVDFLNGKRLVRTNLDVNRTLHVNAAEAKVITTKSKALKRVLKPYATTGFGLDYKHEEDDFNDFEKEVLLPQKQSTMGPFMSVADINGDHLDDLLIGGAAGQATCLYLQGAEGRFTKSMQPAFENDRNYEDMQSVFFDLDKDSDLDLLVISGGNSYTKESPYYFDRLYLNDGQGVFNRRSQKVLDKPYSGKCVTKIDYDRDGDIDILIGNRIIPQSYPIAAPSLLLENENGMLVDRTKDIVPQLAEVGIVNDIVITDLNGDGWDDFITVGEWTGIHRFRNDHGVFVKEQDTLLRNLAGWWLSIQETDVNSDGKPDFVVGNVGENIKHKASKDKPFKVYANDFDNTGNLDIVLSSPYKGEYVPVRGRECSSQQMPMIAEKFKTYSSFAQASLVDIYGEDKLTDAYVRQAVTFKSILLLNNGEGDFTIHNLPHYAQMFPLLDMVEEDLNQDGFADLIIAGCIYDTEVETPRLDNGHGLVLLSNKSDGYFLGDQDQYRIFIPGDVKSLQTIAIADEEYLLAAKNDDVLSIFKVDR